MAPGTLVISLLLLSFLIYYGFGIGLRSVRIEVRRSFTSPAPAVWLYYLLTSAARQPVCKVLLFK